MGILYEYEGADSVVSFFQDQQILGVRAAEVKRSP